MKILFVFVIITIFAVTDAAAPGAYGETQEDSK